MRDVSTVISSLSVAMLAYGCTVFHEMKEVSVVDHPFPIGQNSITYIGHATVLIHVDSLNIITDPVFSDRIGWFAKRYVEPGIRFEKLPPIDAIVISHEHIDHLDKPTLKRFSKDIPVILSEGLGRRIRALGFRDVRELQWWDSTTIRGVTITAAPAGHIFSKSSSYVVKGSKTVYFAGDTGLFDGFSEIGRRFEIDVALLPIGDYHPRLWFLPGFRKMTRKRHMAPEDIPAAMTMLGAQFVIPIHWGTFKISGTALDEPIRWMQEILQEKKLQNKISILHHGGRKKF